MDKDIIDQGSFYVPHCIYDKEFKFNKGLRTVLVVLFAYQDKYLSKTKGGELRKWFNVGNDAFCKMAGISYDTLRKYRHILIERGWIEYKRGYSERNSDYRLLIDNFYLANKYIKEDTY